MHEIYYSCKQSFRRKKTILVSFVRVGAQFDGENVGIYDVFNQ